jgi:hypothetical protein
METSVKKPATEGSARTVAAAVTLIATILSLPFAATPQSATARTEPAKKTVARPGSAKPSRTPWGAPDLQGIWDFATITPVERPNSLAGKEVFTNEEAAQFEKQTLEQRNQDRRDGTRDADVARAYNHFWWDFGTSIVGTKRTSLIVDPPDGRIPSLTEEGKKRASALSAVRSRVPHGPEDRNLWERCIIAPNAGPPMLPSAYNNNVQIFQTPQNVVMLNEMINDARIVPLDGRPHLPANIRLWRGDSRGHWQGNTLVVETTNFRDDTGFRGASASMKLVEKFTRVGPDTLMYEFTIDDPATWTRPWSVAFPMKKTEGPIYEYACHEGNYGMTNLLSGARAQENSGEGRKTAQ